MHKKPLVSIITPTYNQANYLGETIESVLSQDYPKFDYCVINDGSSDDTEKILKKYTNRLQWETHENIGETATVNQAAKNAQGEFIAIVNSDDPLLPGAISTLVEALVSQPELVAVYPDWKMIDSEGKEIKIVQSLDYSYQNMLRWHYCLPGPGAMFSKELFLQLNGRDPAFRFVADYDFWLRAGLIGKIARVPTVLATYRRYADGATSAKRGLEMADEHIRLVNKILSLPNFPTELSQIGNEALSSANYYAGIVCANNFWKQRTYYVTAFRYSPKKYFGEYRFRVLEMLVGFLISPSIRLKLQRLYQKIRNKTKAILAKRLV